MKSFLIFLILLTGISLVHAESPAITDPFDHEVKTNQMNSSETVFTYETEVNSAEEFIRFLKKHQNSGTLLPDYDALEQYSYPQKDYLLPRYIFHNSKFHPEIMLDLEKYRDCIEVRDITHSKLGNSKIFILDISRFDFKEQVNMESWHIRIRMSNQGHLSYRFSMGK